MATTLHEHTHVAIEIRRVPSWMEMRCMPACVRVCASECTCACPLGSACACPVRALARARAPACACA
eukprot:2371405-Pleurochrysis_carterae.AAC.3